MEGKSLLAKPSLFDVLVIGLISLGVVFLFISFKGKILGESVDVEYIKNNSVEFDQVVVVDVRGAVVNPGVYSLGPESRLKDALIAAGGLDVDADREWVGRVLNMAEKVSDGEKIYIPEENSSPVLGGELVDINTASQSQLDDLWGVGESRARAIIEGRPYKNIEELVLRKIVPWNVFDANKEKISVY